MEQSQPTIILIRHADVTPMPGDDPEIGPPLNAAGTARASELCHVLANAGIGAIFVTHFQRTRQTTAPLAEKLGLEARIIDADDEIVAAIQALPAAALPLVIGHSNTVPSIIARLGGPSLSTLAPTEFDNLFVLTGRSLTHLRYGAHSADD